MVKVIDTTVWDREPEAFECFCETYDIPVMDAGELFEIFDNSGPGYALRRWRQMQNECND